MFSDSGIFGRSEHQRAVALQRISAGVVAPSNPADWLRERLTGKEVVLFCGAGISIAAPANAPAFLSLRDNAILAALDILVSRGLITENAIAVVEHAVDRLEERCDLSLPPEQVFGIFSNALGFEVVHKLLEVCLSNGSSNFNHLAIHDLSQSRKDWSLIGVITPNLHLLGGGFWWDLICCPRRFRRWRGRNRWLHYPKAT